MAVQSAHVADVLSSYWEALLWLELKSSADREEKKKAATLKERAERFTKLMRKHGKSLQLDLQDELGLVDGGDDVEENEVISFYEDLVQTRKEVEFAMRGRKNKKSSKRLAA